MSFISKTILAICATLALMLVAARAGTIYWSDNFESNAGARWTTNNVWQIGSPTMGPPINSTGYRARSGSRCATTGLRAGAPASMDSRFICTNYNGLNFLTLPSADQHPRLRFWQWFDFVNSGAIVELRVAGTTNWQVISITNVSSGGSPYVSSGVWSRPSLDLSSFAGQNVQFAFHFISGINYGSDPGWSIDDVAVVVDAPVFKDPESFEGGLGDWAVDSGTWEVGVPLTGPPTNSSGSHAHSGTNCAATVLGGNYGWLVNTRLISPPFTVPASGTNILRFWQWYDFVNAGGFVEVTSVLAVTNFISVTNVMTMTNTVISTNTSVTVTNFVTVTNVSYDTNVFVTDVSTNVTTTSTIATNNWQTISPIYVSSGNVPITSNGQWTNTILDLTPFSGQTLQVAFHFESGISGYGNAAGWYIDDLTFMGLPVLTVPAARIIIKGQTFTATATATNSSQPDSQFTFRLASPSTNAFITSDGIINWTNTSPKVGVIILPVVVTDDAVPPNSITNNFTVTVWPTYTLSASNTFSNKYFLLILQSATNKTWEIDASTNLRNWQTVFTGLVPPSGFLQFTDRLATNFPARYYRATYP